MSNYGNPPENPYGQQQEPYGQPAGYATAPTYAHWGKRVGATLIDSLVMVLAMIPYYIGLGMNAAAMETTNDPTTGVTTATGGGSGLGVALMVIGGILGLAIFIWNICIKGGRTGWTIGKGVMGIRLLKESTGQPIGAGMAFLRQVLHIVDQLPCYIGYLWPLWDSKRQTFADKILSTVVIEQPKG